jgi:hypothetical protein
MNRNVSPPMAFGKTIPAVSTDCHIKRQGMCAEPRRRTQKKSLTSFVAQFTAMPASFELNHDLFVGGVAALPAATIRSTFHDGFSDPGVPLG